jgi:putative two-component system response regulator
MRTVQGPRARILVVDDNPSISTLLQQVLAGEGYEVIVAADGLEAIARVAERKPDLILLDLDMPRLHGDEVCRRLKQDPATRFIPIVIVTGQGELQHKLAAWEDGADDFLTKPFRLIEVTTRCRSLLRIKQLVEERDSAEAVVFALARAVEAKSPYTHGHSERVTEYALALADALGTPPAERELLRKGALLHDIGKISIPDAILNKRGPLTAAEYIIVQGHAAQGAHIVEPLSSLKAAVPLIRWHHERLDGRGYPDGLAGDAIPLLVRALSVADIYDSLASERPYRGVMPHAACMEVLRENALHGGLDLELVSLFDAVLGRTPPDHRGDATGGTSLRAPISSRDELLTAADPPHHRDVVLLPAAGTR